MLEKVGNLKDMELAAAQARSGYQGPVFIDSDLYKALEAASCSLAAHPDPDLEGKLDAIIARVEAAQRPDGYLNTWYQVNAPEKRWSNLRDDHELYCAGHLFEAAAAHHAATGKRTLLTVAERFADNIDSVFGSAPGKRMGYCGHPEIELALIRLGRHTGEKRYLDLARFFLESRGSRFFAGEHGTPPEKYDGAYWQDQAPVREHRKVAGHAVRMVYFLCGAADLAAETGDPGLLRMLERVWRNATGANMYVTGGIGSSAHNEGFTEDYDLPNLTAYQETCASVAVAMWAHRMNLLTGESRFADVLERVLHNGFAAGVSLDGTRFFYVNPLASRGDHHRQEWYGCACCPPNVTRTLAALGGYAYATSPGAFWVNLYIQGEAEAQIDGRKVRMSVESDYPWDGEVLLRPTLESPGRFQLRLRVPDWCEGESVSVNGAAVEAPVRDRGYLVVEREWAPGDEVRLSLPMPVRRVAAHPKVKANSGRLAIQRGPIVYCLEGCDHNVPVSKVGLSATAPLAPVRRDDLLGGVTVLTGKGEVAEETEWENRLYAPASPARPVEITAVPYCVWDNREAGEMAVWIPETAPPSPAPGLAGRAQVELSFVSSNCQPSAVHDGIEPARSSEQAPATCHWWPHKGGEEWVQYGWAGPVTVERACVYWFDDTGRGECRLPKQWRLEYRDGEAWKPVDLRGKQFPVQADAWCEVEFEPVSTDRLRLLVQMQDGYAAGVHEWKVE